MKQFLICFFLVISLLCLSACGDGNVEPTADVYAIQLGDTEKQVIEKAGEPDFKKGLGYDVFGYITNEFETEAKLFWIRDEKVIMMATWGEDFSDWKVDDSFAFQAIKNPGEISVWEPGLDIFDIIGYFGPGVSDWLVGNFADTITYELEDGESLHIHFYMGLIQEAIHIEKDGKETVLWELGQNGSYLH